MTTAAELLRIYGGAAPEPVTIPGIEPRTGARRRTTSFDSFLSILRPQDIQIPIRSNEDPGFFSDLWAAAKRSDVHASITLAGFYSMFDLVSEEKTLELRRQMQALEQRDPTHKGSWPRKLATKTAAILPPIVRGHLRGAKTGVAAAGATALAGAAIPLPEELLTVPAAFTAAWKGGSASYWYQQGAGEMYLELREAGVSKKIARQIALGAGVPYAAIEMVQFGGLIPGMKKEAKTAGKNAALGVLRQYATTVAKEVAEEPLQEITMIGALEAGKAIENYMHDTALQQGNVGEMAERVYRSAVDAIGPMALLALPSGGYSYLQARNVNRAADKLFYETNQQDFSFIQDNLSGLPEAAQQELMVFGETGILPPDGWSHVGSEPIANAITRIKNTKILFSPQFDRLPDGRFKPGLGKHFREIFNKNLYAVEDTTRIKIRELIQNSSDAGAPKVMFHYDPETRRLSTRDEGRGMAEQTVATNYINVAEPLTEEKEMGGAGVGKIAILDETESFRMKTAFRNPDGLWELTELKGETKIFYERGFHPTTHRSKIPAEIADDFWPGEPGKTGTSLDLIMLPGKFSPEIAEEYLEDKVLPHPGRVPITIAANFLGGNLLLPSRHSAEQEILSLPKTWSLKPLAVEELLGTKIRIYADTAMIRTTSARIHVANYGLHHFTLSDYLGESITIPRNIYVDLESAGTPRDPNYPFHLDRESMRPKFQQRVSKMIREKVLSVAMVQEKDRFIAAFKKKKKIPRSMLSFLDASQTLPEEEVTMVAGTIALTSMPAATHKAFHLIENAARAAKLITKPIVFSGFALGTNSVGMYIPANYLEAKGKHPILVDIVSLSNVAWNHMRVLRTLGFGRETSAELYRMAFVDQLLAVLKHEIAHASGARDGSRLFTDTLTMLDGITRRSLERTSKALIRSIPLNFVGYLKTLGETYDDLQISDLFGKTPGQQAQFTKQVHRGAEPQRAGEPGRGREPTPGEFIPTPGEKPTYVLIEQLSAIADTPKGRAWVAAAKENLKKGRHREVTIAFDDVGRPFVADGNARIVAAREMGLVSLPVRAQYEGREEENQLASWIAKITPPPQFMALPGQDFFNPNSTSSEGRVRLRSKKDFSGLKRMKFWEGQKLPVGISLVGGYHKESKQRLPQELRFDRKQWTAEMADLWLRKQLQFTAMPLADYWLDEAGKLKQKIENPGNIDRQLLALRDEERGMEPGSKTKEQVKKAKGLEHRLALSDVSAIAVKMNMTTRASLRTMDEDEADAYIGRLEDLLTGGKEARMVSEGKIPDEQGEAPPMPPVPPEVGGHPGSLSDAGLNQFYQGLLGKARRVIVRRQRKAVKRLGHEGTLKPGQVKAALLALKQGKDISAVVPSRDFTRPEWWETFMPIPLYAGWLDIISGLPIRNPFEKILSLKRAADAKKSEVGSEVMGLLNRLSPLSQNNVGRVLLGVDKIESLSKEERAAHDSMQETQQRLAPLVRFARMKDWIENPATRTKPLNVSDVVLKAGRAVWEKGGDDALVQWLAQPTQKHIGLRGDDAYGMMRRSRFPVIKETTADYHVALVTGEPFPWEEQAGVPIGTRPLLPREDQDVLPPDVETNAARVMREYIRIVIDRVQLRQPLQEFRRIVDAKDESGLAKLHPGARKILNEWRDFVAGAPMSSSQITRWMGYMHGRIMRTSFARPWLWIRNFFQDPAIEFARDPFQYLPKNAKTMQKLMRHEYPQELISFFNAEVRQDQPLAEQWAFAVRKLNLPVLRQLESAAEFMAKPYFHIDTGARAVRFFSMYDASKEAIRDWSDGKRTPVQALSKIGFQFHPTHVQLSVLEKLSNGQLESAARELATSRVLITHWAYSRAERSHAERGEMRYVVSLFVWSRGLGMELARNVKEVIRPSTPRARLKALVWLGGFTAMGVALNGMKEALFGDDPYYDFGIGAVAWEPLGAIPAIAVPVTGLWRDTALSVAGMLDEPQNAKEIASRYAKRVMRSARQIARAAVPFFSHGLHAAEPLVGERVFEWSPPVHNYIFGRQTPLEFEPKQVARQVVMGRRARPEGQVAHVAYLKDATGEKLSAIDDMVSARKRLQPFMTQYRKMEGKEKRRYLRRHRQRIMWYKRLDSLNASIGDLRRQHEKRPGRDIKNRALVLNRRAARLLAIYRKARQNESSRNQ